MDEQPEARHMQAYRERLTLYLSMGQTPEQVIESMTNYFPWFGAWFGLETDRAGNTEYFVAIGPWPQPTFYAVIAPAQ
jgi:hypothetical protein